MDNHNQVKLCKAFIKNCRRVGQSVTDELIHRESSEIDNDIGAETIFRNVTSFSLLSAKLTQRWVAERFDRKNDTDVLVQRAWQGNLLGLRLTQVESRIDPEFSYKKSAAFLEEYLMLCFAAYADGDEANAKVMAALLRLHSQHGAFANNAYSEPDMLAFINWLLAGMLEDRWPEWREFTREESFFTRLIDAAGKAAEFADALFQHCDLRLARSKGFYLPTDAKKKRAFMYYYEALAPCAWLTDLLAFQKLYKRTHGEDLCLDIEHPVMKLYICHVPDMSHRLDDPLLNRVTQAVVELENRDKGSASPGN